MEWCLRNLHSLFDHLVAGNSKYKIKRFSEEFEKHDRKDIARERHTPYPGIVVPEAILCASNLIDALICLAFSSLGNIAEAPLLHFSMNLC